MAQAVPGDVLRRHEDGRTRLPGGEGGAPPLARAPGRRPRRPAAVAQPGRRHRVGIRAPRGWRARGGRRGARGRARSLHRHHRAWTLDPSHASAVARAFPVRLGAAPVQLPADAGRAVRGGVRGARCDLREGVAIQTIKSIALAPWDGRPQTASTWHEPLTDPADISLAADWVLGRYGKFLNTVGDVRLLPSVLAAAEKFAGDRPSDEGMNALVQRHSLKPLFV